jgi:hypothetical protein
MKMADPIAEKIKQTQNSFPTRAPGAVEPCPFAKPVAKAESAPVEVKTAFALTQYGTNLPVSSSEKQKEKKDWIEIILVDMEGKPVPNMRYRITAPDGKIQEGRLNEHGQAGYYQIEAGNCKITFPDLDKDAWE